MVRITHESGGNPIPEDLESVLFPAHHPGGGRVEERTIPEDSLGISSETALLQSDDLESSRYVDLFEVAPAAGHGATLEDAEKIGSLTFQRQWLDRQGLNAKECAVVRVKGESMEPTLPDGCSILLNRASRARRNGRIFVITTGDNDLVVKRLRRDGKRWSLVSDNPSWDPAPFPEQGKIEGEVRWMARALP